MHILYEFLELSFSESEMNISSKMYIYIYINTIDISKVTPVVE